MRRYQASHANIVWAELRFNFEWQAKEITKSKARITTTSKKVSYQFQTDFRHKCLLRTSNSKRKSKNFNLIFVQSSIATYSSNSILSKQSRSIKTVFGVLTWYLYVYIHSWTCMYDKFVSNRACVFVIPHKPSNTKKCITIQMCYA